MLLRDRIVNFINEMTLNAGLTVIVVFFLAMTAGLIMTACGTTTPPPTRWNMAPQTFHVDIVVGKYTHDTCVNAGGTWVTGDSKDWLNVMAGCIEEPSTK